MSDTVASVGERDVYTARLRAIDSRFGFPCLSYALMSMQPIITNEVKTVNVDKHWRIYVNPEFFNTLTVDEGAMVLIHEAWHLLSEHYQRAAMRGIAKEDRYIWNIAGDCEINSKTDIVSRLPKSAMTPSYYNFPENLLAEEYFTLLKDQETEDMRNGTGCGPGGGDCGSCSHGLGEDHELPPDEESSGITDIRAKLIRDEVAHRILEDYENKSIGNVPAGWIRWAKKTLKPEVDWRVYLRAALSNMLATSYGKAIPTYKRLSRRQFKYPDFIIPAYCDPIPHVAVIVDTSGSMSEAYIGQGLTEIDAILHTLGNGVSVDVYFTDAVAYEAQQVNNASSLTPYGGGGTDMTEGFEAIDKRAKLDPSTRPSIITCLTDGLTPWPLEAPTYAQVCIVVIGDSGTSPDWAVPPNHATVRIKVKETKHGN